LFGSGLSGLGWIFGYRAAAIGRLNLQLERPQRNCTQQRKDKNKLDALHDPEVECI
jgi:IS5 family transposase